jgi:uncharacterized protein
MKNLFVITMLLLTLLVGKNSFAAFTVPAPNGNIVDTSGKLTDAQRNSIQGRITEINAHSKNEIGVLIVPTLDGMAPATAALMVFDSWKIGKKGLDNGVLLLVAVNDHKLRIATGKGVDGELTDLQANDIINQQITPSFKHGDFAQGIINGVNAIDATLETRVQTTATTESTENNGSSHEGFFIFLIGSSFALLSTVFFFWNQNHQREQRRRLEELEESLALQRQADKTVKSSYENFTDSYYHAATTVNPESRSAYTTPKPQAYVASTTTTTQKHRTYVAPISVADDEPVRRKRDSDSGSGGSSGGSWGGGDSSSGGGFDFGGGSSGGGGSDGSW